MISEHKVDKLSDAAVLADDYSSIHKNTFSKPDVGITINPSVQSQNYGLGLCFRHGNQERAHTDGTRHIRSVCS